MSTNALAEATLLEEEAFPGELASLRAQLSQNKVMLAKTQQYKQSNISGVNLLEEKIKIEEKIKNSNSAQMADQLIEMMPTGLVMLDGDGVVVKINKVARGLLDEPILGQPWFSVIARSFKPRADDWHEVSLKDGRRVKLEIANSTRFF